MRQHAVKLHKARSLTLEVEGELATRQGGGAATGCCAWIPRTAAGAPSTREQANRLYMSPSVGGGGVAPSNQQMEVAAPLLQISRWPPACYVSRSGWPWTSRARLRRHGGGAAPQETGLNPR